MSTSFDVQRLVCISSVLCYFCFPFNWKVSDDLKLNVIAKLNLFLEKGIIEDIPKGFVKMLESYLLAFTFLIFFNCFLSFFKINLLLLLKCILNIIKRTQKVFK